MAKVKNDNEIMELLSKGGMSFSDNIHDIIDLRVLYKLKKQGKITFDESDLKFKTK